MFDWFKKLSWKREPYRLIWSDKHSLWFIEKWEGFPMWMYLSIWAEYSKTEADIVFKEFVTHGQPKEPRLPLNHISN